VDAPGGVEALGVEALSVEPALQNFHGGSLIDHGPLFAAANSPLGKHPGR
jgi:hypothetical protein